MFCADAIANLLYTHLVSTEDLGKHLDYAEKTLRSITEEAVAVNLEKMDDEVRRQVPGSWSILDRPWRTLITLAGQITYRRRAYRDEYGNRRYLLDEILGIASYQRIEASAFLWMR